MSGITEALRAVGGNCRLQVRGRRAIMHGELWTAVLSVQERPALALGQAADVAIPRETADRTPTGKDPDAAALPRAFERRRSCRRAMGAARIGAWTF